MMPARDGQWFSSQCAEITVSPGDPPWFPCGLPLSASLCPPAIFCRTVRLLAVQKFFPLAVRQKRQKGDKQFVCCCLEQHWKHTACD